MEYLYRLFLVCLGIYCGLYICTILDMMDCVENQKGFSVVRIANLVVMLIIVIILKLKG